MSIKVLVVALCVVTAHAFRTKKDSKHRTNCPPFAELKMVKGSRCMHMTSGENVKEECCEEPSAASGSGSSCDSLDEFQTLLRHRMQLYMIECHLSKSDVSWDAAGDFSVDDNTRLCSKACQDVEELSEQITYPDFASLRAQCDTSLVDELEKGATVLTTLDAARGSCAEEDQGNDGMCPDLSMATHDCGHYGTTEESCKTDGCCWNPPQDAPGRPWRNRPWCYRMASSVQCDTFCPNDYDRKKREDCSAFLILKEFTNPDPHKRGQACEDVGCCWQPLEHGSNDPWCFYKPCVAPA